MPAYPTVDECRDRLHRAGWSIGETAIGPDHALVWLVTGTNGENVLRLAAKARPKHGIGRRHSLETPQARLSHR